jgi:hypothetical protein
LATLSVASGAVYQINVGGAGGAGATTANAPGGAGGFNGGAGGGATVIPILCSGLCGSGGGGGGASDIRTSGGGLSDRLIIAGGGGGGGGIGGGGGGGGGGYYGGGGGVGGIRSTLGGGGGGGTQTAGGTGGSGDGSCNAGSGNGSSGSSGVGGPGGSADCAGGGTSAGGAGGDTVGANGGPSYGGAGGGGGSGFGPTGVTFHGGAQSGDGKVVITYAGQDSTPPTTTISLSPASPNGQNGWYNRPLAVSIAATDPDDTSGIQTRCALDPASVPASFGDLPATPCAYLGAGVNVSQDGIHTVYAGSEDPAGNVESPVRSASFKLDTTAPTIAASATKADGTTYTAGSWTNQTVTTHFACADALSGVASCPADQVFGADGVTPTTSGTATDTAGNQATASFGPIQVDKTAPTISAAATTSPNASGWYTSNVTVHFTCQDALSGIPASACPADQVLSSEGNAVSSATQTVQDVAGNTSGPSNVVAVAIDKTAPAVSVTGVSNGSSYTLGSVPTPGCATTDALSGVATPATAQVSGGTSNGVGTFTAICSGGKDMAGNVASPASATYTVGYGFGGFLAPVDNPPTLNTGKAGRTYPVKWQLTNASGGFVSSLSTVASVSYKATSCGTFTGDPTDALETSTTGGSSLRYDSTANQYVYNWATPSAGCYSLFLTLDSGQVFPAYFSLQ